MDLGTDRPHLKFADDFPAALKLVDTHAAPLSGS